SGRRGSHPDEVGWPFDPQIVDVRERWPLLFCNDMSKAEAVSFLAKLGQDSWPRPVYAATDWPARPLNSVPASYVVCLKDQALPVNWQETFAARVNAQRLVHIDAGHQVMNPRPQALAEVLLHEAA